MLSKDDQLAIRDGNAVFEEGPPVWPLTTGAIRDSVTAALDDNSWGLYHGQWTEQLEQQLAATFDKSHCILASSGTIAVELALRGAAVSSGDEVILAGYDFPGNFRAIEAVGAQPVLVDTVVDGWVMDPRLVAEAVSDDTKAIVISHLHGQIAEVDTIRKKLQSVRDDIVVIEDACQVPGATVNGNLCGTAGDISVLSFGGSKLLTAGRGGAVLTNEDQHAQRARIFSSRGNDAFPMSQLQAAALLPQLDSLHHLTRLRHESVQFLLDRLADENRLVPLRQTTVGNILPAYYKLPWLLNSGTDDWTREEFIQAIQAEGVAIDAAFKGFTRRSRRRCRKATTLENSKAAAEQTLLLHHPILMKQQTELEKVAVAIEKVFRHRPHG